MARLVCLVASIGTFMFAPVTATSGLICLYGILISSVSKASQTMIYFWYPVAMLFAATLLTDELALPLVMVFASMTYLASK